MFNGLNKLQLGMGLGLIGYSSFSLSDAFAKWFTGHYPIFQIVFMVNLMAAILLLLALPKLGGYRALWNVRRKDIHFYRSALNVGISLIIIYSFRILPLSDVYTFIFAVPFYAAIFAIPIYGERVSRNRWIAIAIGFAGVVVALQPGQEGFDTTVILPILSGVLIAAMFLLAKSLQGESLFSLAFWPVMANVVVAGALTFAGEFETVSMAHIPLLLCYASFMIMGIICVSSAFRYAPASAVSPLLYIEMVWALILGYIIFQDVPDAMMLFGAAIIMLSGVYLVLSEHERGKI